MTKDEILNYFKDINHAYNESTRYDELKRMLDELTEPCEDAISRQATVERLCKVAEFMNEKRNGLGSPYVMAALFIQDNKDEFPSITPKPKTGHWKYYRNNKGDWINECSACGLDAGVGYPYQYCPNCGAKMEEKEKNNG